MKGLDCKIQNGDISLDSCGKYIHLIEEEELLQRAYIKIAMRFGKFFYNRKLGVENLPKKDDDRFVDKFNLIIKEALVDCPKVFGEVVECNDNGVRIFLKCGDFEREDIIYL